MIRSESKMNESSVAHEWIFNKKIRMYDRIISGGILSRVARGGGQNSISRKSRIVANMALICCLVSVSAPTVNGSSSAIDALTKQQLATNHRFNLQQHNNLAGQSALSDWRLAEASQQDAEFVLPQPPAAAAGEQCLRLPNSDSVICVPFQSQQAERSQRPDLDESPQSFYADFKRTDKLGLAGSQLNRQQSTLSREKTSTSNADNYNDYYYSGSAAAAAANNNNDDNDNNNGGYYKLIERSARTASDACAGYGRQSLVDDCRRRRAASGEGGSVKLAATASAAALTSELAAEGEAKGQERRHQLSTRARRLAQSQRPATHSFRMSTEEARQLLESPAAQETGWLAPPSSLESSGSGLDRSPIMLVRLSDARNRRRSDGAADGANFWSPGAKRLRLLWPRPTTSAPRSQRSGPTNETDAAAAPSDSTDHLEAANLALVGQSEPTPLMSGGAVDEDGGPLVAREDSPLECTKRRYTFKAVRADALGNKCTGLVRASICYGGCDTGEIADWLFPHKKSIHKVCSHGTRVARVARLEECSSPDVDERLREYRYVDAHNCVCQRCQSADTTCLGSLTRPYLPTLANGSSSSALVY